MLAHIGRGGMGEVYRARDTRLDPTVALKIPPHADPELRARFEVEARAVGALSHPDICTIHDVGSQDDVEFLVMEFSRDRRYAVAVELLPDYFDSPLLAAPVSAY